MKVSVTMDDIRLKSNLKTNLTLILTEKSFFYTILGFTRSHSYPLDDTDRFCQLIAGSYKGNSPINITRIDKIRKQCTRTYFASFALSSPPGHKKYKEPRIKLLKKIKNQFYHILRFILKMMITNPLIFMLKRYLLLVNSLKYKIRIYIHTII